MNILLTMNLAAAGLGLMSFAIPALAHHSFSSEFDSKKEVTLTGTVTRIEWMNPHAFFYLDMRDENGKVTGWEFEMGSPNSLLRAGWTRNSLKPGDAVAVHGFLAKDGSRRVKVRFATLSDGRKVFAESSYQDEN